MQCNNLQKTVIVILTRLENGSNLVKTVTDFYNSLVIGISILLPKSVTVKVNERRDTMAQATAFGKAIKTRLIDMDKKQSWLIEQVKERTGLDFDDAYLWKITRGKLKTPSIVTAIQEILDIPAISDD